MPLVNPNKTLEIDNNLQFKTVDQVNQLLNAFLKSQETSELLRLIVIFEKVPKGISFGIDVKMGTQNGVPVRTSIRVNANCSISFDRSQSGETLGNSNYFKYLRDVPTEYDCARERKVKMELILDHNSVEAFFFEWYSVTNLVFSDEKNKGIEIWTSLD